jgi:hypothetical protein
MKSLKDFEHCGGQEAHKVQEYKTNPHVGSGRGVVGWLVLLGELKNIQQAAHAVSVQSFMFNIMYVVLFQGPEETMA